MSDFDRPHPLPRAGGGEQTAPHARPGRSTLLVTAGALLALALLLWLLVPRSSDGEMVPSAESSARHVEEPVSYAQTPPTEGDHHPVWWDCGVYATEIPEEHAVHSLEHGAVWLSYREDAEAADVDRLRRVASRDYMLMSPHPRQAQRFVATAWGHQLTQDELDVPAIEAFVREHRKSNSAPEPGALCTNGTTRDLVKR